MKLKVNGSRHYHKAHDRESANSRKRESEVKLRIIHRQVIKQEQSSLRRERLAQTCTDKLILSVHKFYTMLKDKLANYIESQS